MKIGYARVSSDGQNLDRQIAALTEAGVEKLFVEKLSGASFENRKEFQKAIDYLREGDFLVVEALDRLGRNYDDDKFVIELLDKKKVGLIVTSMPILNQEIGDPSMQKFIRDMIFQMLAWIAERERTESKRRQAQGIAIAKAEGVYKGKVPEYSANAKNLAKRAVYNQVKYQLSIGLSVSEIARSVGITRHTVYEIKKR
ncbi:recombinase family protein [Periweissella cryptocerci]|uniref:Recombinase family protein n=1 Tax=Periweissella cryptocerci TaxID=2506420 RepID=A0A4P6YX41_9LACO|nr:recombinase family protein [Periweissella cryptocerci]QBO37376.1 recombinase family protein [Periweissella cryptocerci]